MADGLFICRVETPVSARRHELCSAWSQRLRALALGFFEGLANIVGVRLRIDLV